MKDILILFSGPMICALLAGTKTQTRRIVQFPQNVDGIPDRIFPAPYAGYGTKGEFVPVNHFGGIATKPFHSHSFAAKWRVGQRLWVREGLVPNDNGIAVYAADGAYATQADAEGKLYTHPWTWKVKSLSARYMPRWACRITLEVTGVSVDKLVTLNDNDAVAEGVKSKKEFIELWKQINGKWQEDLWVWIVKFQRV